MKLWGTLVALYVCLGVIAAEPPMDPVPVCDVLSAWKEWDGKAVAVLGRYEFRRTGGGNERRLDQEACGDQERRGVILLTADEKNAPKPPDTVALDERSLERKIGVVKKRTQLAKFRFGSADYDRWAVVYGRLDGAEGEGKTHLTYRGDGAVFFLVDR